MGPQGPIATIPRTAVRFSAVETRLDRRDGLLVFLPFTHESLPIHRHVLLDMRTSIGFLVEVDLHESVQEFDETLDRAKRRVGIDANTYPYAFSAAQWSNYCVEPHSHINLGDNDYHIGLNMFNRFLRVNTYHKEGGMEDPGVNDALLSTTNWVDPDNGEMWFASWHLDDTLHRLHDHRAPVEVPIWRRADSTVPPREMWRGPLGDSLHHLALSPDKRFLVLCELGIVPESITPAGSFEDQPCKWQQFQAKGVVPSTVLVLDLDTGDEWRLPPIATAAHVEFDPEDPRVCYMSGHNTAIVRGQVAVFGPGEFVRYRLGNGAPRKEGSYSCPDCYRVISHRVFRHRDRVLLGATGYPNEMFFFDARTGELYRRVAFGHGERVDPSGHPHLCGQAPYGFVPSCDGEYAYVGGNGFLLVICIDTGVIEDSWDFSPYCRDFRFTGHASSRFVQ